LPPSRRHGFDNPEYDQAEPKVDQHAPVDLERGMVSPHRKMFLQQEIDRIACQHSCESMEEIGG